MRRFAIILAALLAVLIVEPAAASGIQVEAVIWQFSRDYPGADASDSDLPIRTVQVKTHDGTDWMSTYDSSPYAVSGPGAIQQLRSSYGSQGIDLVAWFVPQGTDVDGQVAIAEQVIDTGVTALYADVEPFAGFCNQDCGYLADAFWKRLRNERPGARLGVMYDPRTQWLGPSAIGAWLSVTDDALPSCYWESFAGQAPWGDPAGCVLQARDDLAWLVPGRALNYVPLLQGDSTPDRVRQALDAAVTAGAGRAGLWRRGVVPASVWDMLRGYAPPPPCWQTLSDGCLLKEVSADPIYVMEAGAKFHIPDPNTFLRMGFHWSAVNIVAGGFTAGIPNIPRDGALLKEETDPPIDVVYGGARFWIPDPGTFAALGFDPAAVRIIPRGGFAQVPLIPIQYTRFHEVSRPEQYVIIAGQRIWLSPVTLQQLLGAGEGQPLYTVPGGGLTQVPERTNIPRGDASCDGNVDSQDALLLLRTSVALPNLGLCSFLANMDCDNAITSVDALLVLRRAAGLPVTPC